MPKIEEIDFSDIDRRNEWEPSGNDIALGVPPTSGADELARGRNVVGLDEFLRVIEAQVPSGSRIGAMHHRFISFVAVAWLVDAPWVAGLGLRELAESLNISHELMRQRALGAASELGLRMKTISPEHAAALTRARAERAQAA